MTSAAEPPSSNALGAWLRTVVPTIVIGAFILWGIVSADQREVESLKIKLRAETDAREKLTEKLIEQRVQTAIDLEQLRSHIAKLTEIHKASEAKMRALLEGQNRRLDRVIDQLLGPQTP